MQNPSVIWSRQTEGVEISGKSFVGWVRNGLKTFDGRNFSVNEKI
jgi:hypothetical protein